MRIAYLDCFSGISGNMVLGALLDAGLELERLQGELARLNLDGYQIVAREVHRRGLKGTYVEVQTEEQYVGRHLQDIEGIIDASALPDAVKEQSRAIFRRLAQAEAKVHGEPIEHVHFHEVGAVDAIVDVVGSAIGFWLLGVEKVYASHVHVGRGTIECAHGCIPLPAPATAELLQGVPIYGRDVDAELVTPTGAAILTTLAAGYGPGPAMIVSRIGYGAGTRDLPIANLLRISIGEAVGARGAQDTAVSGHGGRTHEHSHPHEHSHGDEHTHEHSHPHEHSHDHEHTHEHSHPHEHSHDDEHTHEHSHPHEHSDEQAHGHSHDSDAASRIPCDGMR